MPDGKAKDKAADHYDLGHGFEHGKSLSPKGRKKLIKKLQKIDKIKVKILQK
jgi:hypothetical protein